MFGRPGGPGTPVRWNDPPFRSRMEARRVPRPVRRTPVARWRPPCGGECDTISFMKIRNAGKMNIVNDAAHSRSLFESIMMPELISVLRDWTEAAGGGVLIGTAALSFHVRPRISHDIDFLFINDNDIPTAIPGYCRISPLRFRYNRTGVEVSVVTPDAIHVPLEVAEEVARTAMASDGVQVASESGLVALQLFRSSRQDEADIVALLKTGRVDLSSFPLSSALLSPFQELVEVAATDPHPP